MYIYILYLNIPYTELLPYLHSRFRIDICPTNAKYKHKCSIWFSFDLAPVIVFYLVSNTVWFGLALFVICIAYLNALQLLP